MARDGHGAGKIHGLLGTAFMGKGPEIKLRSMDVCEWGKKYVGLDLQMGMGIAKTMPEKFPQIYINILPILFHIFTCTAPLHKSMQP